MTPPLGHSLGRRGGALGVPSRVNELVQYKPLSDSSSDKGRLASDEVDEGNGGEDGAGGDGTGSSGSAEDESIGSEGRGDPGAEEERLRRGGDQADSQGASDQALDECMFTKYEVILEDSNMLEKKKVNVKTLTITFMVKLLCYLFLW